MDLPEIIGRALEPGTFQADAVGMSNASVLLLPHQVLKIQPAHEEAANEVQMLGWLKDKLPVPQVLAYTEEEGISYLLMERCPGAMACDTGYLDSPETLVGLLSDTLKALWAVDVTHCPCDQSLARKLRQAAYNVESGLVDVDEVEPETFGPGGFKDPADLLRWLETHRPPEEKALIHGDFCLPNLFADGDRLTGLIDLGRGGVGDPWCDIAICWRSLRSNFSGRYGGTPRPGFDPDVLFEVLGVEPDREKLRYYLLLDELL